MAVSAETLTTKPPPAGPWHASCGLPNALSSAQTSRRWLAEQLAELHTANIADTACLVVSELAANAVKHTGGPFEVHIHKPMGGYVRLEVRDYDTHPPHICPADKDAESGRGLAMVAACSYYWGHERTRSGKVVYAYLECGDGT